MPVDNTRINWNVLFKAFRSYSVIVHLELVDDLFLHERKLQFLHCKTTTSWAIFTRKSRHPTCNKDPLSNLIPHHFIPLCTSRKFMERKQTINAEKVLFLLAALIPALIFSGKNKKAAGRRITKKCHKRPKRLRHQKNHLSHPSVVEKSIKRVQNKDVRKSQRKSWNQIVFFTSSDVISAKNVQSPYRQTF